MRRSTDARVRLARLAFGSAPRLWSYHEYGRALPRQCGKVSLKGCCMRRLPRHAVCLLAGTVLWGAVVASSGAAEPAESGAVARGEQVARNVCSACHVATRDQPPGNVPAQGPSFTDIANRPDTSLKSLRHFIATTHWDMKTLPATMPNPMLTDSQVSDVSHYILSLRTAGAGSK